LQLVGGRSRAQDTSKFEGARDACPSRYCTREGCAPVPGGPCIRASSLVKAALRAAAWEMSSVVPATRRSLGKVSGRPTSTASSACLTLRGAAVERVGPVVVSRSWALWRTAKSRLERGCETNGCSIGAGCGSTAGCTSVAGAACQHITRPSNCQTPQGFQGTGSPIACRSKSSTTAFKAKRWSLSPAAGCGCDAHDFGPHPSCNSQATGLHDSPRYAPSA
jgi:hypothetical protein